MIGLFKSGKRPASWSWDNDWFISSPEKDQQVDLETMIGLFWVRKKPTTSSLPTSREQTTPTGGVVMFSKQALSWVLWSSPEENQSCSEVAEVWMLCFQGSTAFQGLGFFQIRFILFLGFILYHH